LIDPNTWSEDGTIALKGVIIADDGKYLTYGVGEAGSDWGMGRVMEVATRKVLEDELKWVKLSGVSWTKDGKGFFYSRFDAPEPGTEFQSLNLNQKLYYHRVGTPQSEDVLVYARPDQPEWLFFGSVTEDGRYLILTVMKAAGPKVRILYKELNEPYGMPLDLIDNFENLYGFVGNEGPEFYFVTDFEAPKKRLIAIDIRQPQRENWREIIGEVEETLEWVSLVGNMFVTHYLKDAKTLVKIYHMDGEFVREVDFPTIGMAYGFGGRRADTETFYVLTGFATPTSIYRYDMVTGKSRLIWQPKVDFSPEEYETKQVFYHSKDGTRVPMFITHKKGIELNSLNPALLTAYGGFGSSSTPYFQPGNIAWMEIGGVLAVANIRGGGEYGEEWHLAGSALNKQNGFDDFIAAAEWLIENKYTRSEKLAIKGASNGGLLVGAVMTQRPDLFGACLPDVGVMDMLRFHRYTSGRFWVEEYGSSDDPEQFKELLAFSPYHNIKEGTNYPPTLVTTADTDDRVVPAHSFKFAAALQQAQRAEAPVLLRVETRAGHGGGKPTSKQIEEAVDGLAFLVEHLGIELPYQ
jgi:prolyl oligopeptidase